MPAQLKYPPAPKIVIEKTIGGLTFEDPYDWLQADTDETLAWQEQQNILAEGNLRSWDGFERLRNAIHEASPLGETSWAFIPRQAGGRWFRLDVTPDEQGQAVWMSDVPLSGGEPVVDTNQLQKHLNAGRTIHVVQFAPAPNGRLVALSLTIGGDANEYFRIVETDSGKISETVFYQHMYQGAFPVWKTDSSGFFLAGERHEDGNHCLKFIKVVQDAPDHPDTLFGFDSVPENMPILTPQISPSGRYVLLISGPHEWTAIQIGDLKTGVWRRFVPQDFSGECYGNWIDDGHYVAVVTDETPRGRVVVIPVETSQDRTTWQEIVPQSNLIMRNLIVTGGKLALVALNDVSLTVKLFGLDGMDANEIPLEPFGYSSLTNRYLYVTKSNELLFTFGTFTRQGGMLHYHADTGELEAIGKPGVVLDDLQAFQHFAVSKDGTRIPYFLVRRKDLDLTHPNPVLIHAYGGFNLPKMPEYLGVMTPFVRAGGIFVLANLRGGSEYGKEWHDGGRLHRKQNTFDDLYAIAEDLIRAGTTSPEKLAFYGRSNGGLTAGVAITQHPDLWRAVVPVVPLLDMMEPIQPGPVAEALRSYLVEDYGDPRDPKFAPIIHRYSPYHNIRVREKYPAVLLVFGEKDLGCPPYHGRKFAARLQASTYSDYPILFRVWGDVGHQAVGSEAVSQFTEIIGFIMRELGMKP